MFQCLLMEIRTFILKELRINFLFLMFLLTRIFICFISYLTTPLFIRIDNKTKIYDISFELNCCFIYLFFCFWRVVINYIKILKGAFSKFFLISDLFQNFAWHFWKVIILVHSVIEVKRHLLSEFNVWFLWGLKT